eukprot:g3442.t1
MDSATCGTLGNVSPGSLLGPIVGLTFSTDGGLIFACSGSSLWVYDVPSGALLSTVRIFSPGVVVYGMDVGRESFGAIFGEKCVRVVEAVPTGADTSAVTSGWFQRVVHLPDLDDRVWDVRLIDSHEGHGGGTDLARRNLSTGGMETPEGNRREDGRRRGTRAGMGLLAVALAHNTVEVWDWVSHASPLRVLRTRGGDPCLLYHARLWGRTLDELRVAAGTVFNQVLVWNPAQADTPESNGGLPGLETRGRKPRITGGLPRRDFGVLRLRGHEGVIFRVAWREDGRQLVSASDDRTVRVWGVDRSGGVGGRSKGDCGGKDNEGQQFCEGQLLWTGWGHASRVWDVGFTTLGVVSCGEDGAAILWGENQSVDKAAHTTVKDATAGASSTTEAPPATTTPSATAQNAQLHGRRDGGQLVPVATMRGHSGINTWRLAVYEFGSRNAGVSSVCDEHSFAAAIESRREERGNDRRWFTLMATGGNDGTCKLWDLDFERTCERRQPWEKRRSGALWGQTESIPVDRHITASPVSPDTVLTGNKSCAADTPSTTLTSLVASAARPAAGRSESCSKKEATAAARNPKGNPLTEPEPSSGTSSSRTHFPQQTSDCSSEQDERGLREQSGGRASRRRGARRRLKKTAVVREVRLAPPSNSGTAAAAAVLITDGGVWWVRDLHVGTWERVMHSVGDAVVVDGVVEMGFSSSAGVSAIAVVRLSQQENHAEQEQTTASDCGGASVKSKKDGGGRGSGCEFAIVVGRDDGWLFLVSQGRPRPPVDGDERKGDQPQSQRTWRVTAAWKGHRSRVTAVWAVGDAARDRRGGSQAFTVALETSRLSKRRDGGGVDGTLVSAGADGTVAWWEWACSEEDRNMVHTGHSGSGHEEMTIPTPRLRMVCEAGPGAAVTSVAIDDHRRPRRRASQNHGGWGTSACTDTADEVGGDEDMPHAGAVIFCGDTKGNIQCFLEEQRSEGGIDGGWDEETPTAGREGLREPVQTCLVLKRQHGKDQISRIALRGNCLFSAGHDGQVNHYVVSYSFSSSSGMLATAEPRHYRSAGVPARHAPGEYTIPSSSTETVNLTIVTTYATTPVTTVSELWVGGGGNSGARPTREAAGSEGQVRIAVAGRSGSSRMSVWDLTEGRQILELDCGEKHLAQDLVLSWPFIDDESGSSLSALHRANNPSTVTMSKTVDKNMLGNDGNNNAGGALHPVPPAIPFCGSRVALARPLLVFPRHAFVFAEPLSSAKGTSTSSKITITEGAEVITGAGAGGASCSEKNDDSLGVLAGEVRDHRQQHRQAKRQRRPGLALAFHSSFSAHARRGGHSGVLPQLDRPCAKNLQAAAENVPDSPTAGLGSASAAVVAVAVPANQPTAEVENATRKQDDRKRSSDHPEGVRHGSFETTGGGGPVSQLPGRFGYSLGKRFHSQRVASVKFIILRPPTERLEAGHGGYPPGLRLVTGGEDGAVMLLDVFYESPRRRSRRQAATAPASETFRRPYARVVQTLPSHASSVGALAVGTYGRVGDADEIGCVNSRERTLVVSGGAKMEARAWCVVDKCGQGGNDTGGLRRKTVEAACAPPVRWLATTTPAPKSSLHAHRIMCLCVLPPPTSQPRLPAGQDNCRSTTFVAGDSGGGVTVFQLRRDAAATGSAVVGSTAAAAAAAGGGRREDRSRPAGRWMTSGERPVLSLAHARVSSSAAQDAALDFVVTGDTGGKVTVWEFVPARGTGVLASVDGGNVREGASDVRGGFVHRGPAGKRRSGDGMSADGVEGAEGPPPCPGLVPVLSYRAHQMGVLCMAVHVPSEGGRMVIITGGDDQAVSVAEVELHESDYYMKPFDKRSTQGGEPSCLSEKQLPEKRRCAIRLVGGRLEVTNGAAGSAIKGISVVPATVSFADTRASQHGENHLSAVAFCTQSASTKDGPATTEYIGRDATGEAHVSPAALVAVSGQGLQLVLFGY